MNETMRVLVAIGDAQARGALCASLAHMNLSVYAAADGEQALHEILSLCPDAVVFSLVLPAWDGLNILERLSAVSLRRYPYMVAVTAIREELRSRALALGADAALIEGADASALFSLLQGLWQKGSSVLSVRHAQRRAGRARRQLLEIGMPPHLKGYDYLARAVAMVSADDLLLRQATTRLYPGIAAECGVSDHSVERAIRHAIESTWTRGRVEALHRVFGNSIDPQRGKPTNTECIAMLAEQLYEQMTREVL